MLPRSALSRRMLLASFWSLFLLAVPISSRADIALSFMPTEEAKFLIKGQGYEGIIPVSLIVDYDTTYISDPQVTVTGGTLLQDTVLDALPGRLHLNIQTEDQNPTFEACLFFQKRGEYPAVINFVTAESIGPGGAQQMLPVVMLANPNLPRQSTGESFAGVAQENHWQQAVQGGGHEK